MRMPHTNVSTAQLSRTVVYLLARLMRNRATRGLAPFVQPALEQLEAAAARTEEAERALVMARANLEGADDELDENVRQVEGRLYAHVGKNRKSDLYRKIFPQGLVAVTGARIEDEVRAVKVLEEAIARELAAVDFAVELGPKLRAAREEVEVQLPPYQAALDALAAAWAAELAARHGMRRQYRVVHAELVKLFPDNLRKVNSFFRDVGARRTAPGPDAGEGGTGSEPA